MSFKIYPFNCKWAFDDDQNDDEADTDAEDDDDDEADAGHLVKNATHVSNLQAELPYSATWNLEVAPCDVRWGGGGISTFDCILSTLTNSNE